MAINNPPITNGVLLICQPVSSDIINTQLRLQYQLPLSPPASASTSTSLTIEAATEDSPEPSPTPTIDEEAIEMEETNNDTTDDGAANGNEDGTSSSCGCSIPASHEPEKECPICMEVFQVGECVSWSASTKCEHVFHYECLKEWLLRRTGCPYCREIFLPVDRQRGRVPSKVLEKMAEEHTQRASSTYYCQVDGLVTLQGLKHKRGQNPNVQDDDVSLKTFGPARRLLTRLRGGQRRQIFLRRQLRHEFQANGNETGLEILASSTTTPQQQRQAIETMPALVVSPLRANSTFMEDDDNDEGSEEFNDAVSETSARRQLEFGDANHQPSPNSPLSEGVANDLEEGRMILLQEDQSKPSDSVTVHGENDSHDHNSLGSSGTIVFETEYDESDDDDDDDTAS
jgi:hypothetical protein